MKERLVLDGYHYELDPTSTVFIGILFSITGGDVDWDGVKKQFIDFIYQHSKFPASFEMPCGNDIYFENAEAVLSLPIEDLPCSCGNPNHWLVRYDHNYLP